MLGFAEAADHAEATLFVGRGELLDRLATLLREADVEPRVIAVVGPGGSGKTALVRQLLRNEPSHRVLWLSGERLAPNPEEFLAAVNERVPGGLSNLGRGDATDVLVLDAYEKLAPLERWLVQDALPAAGARLAVILTSREHLSLWARSQIGAVARELTVPPLSDAEVATYLSRRGVPEDAHTSIFDYTGGHPLALSLIADHLALQRGPFEPDLAPDVITSLVHEFLRDAPTPAHESALFALAVAWSLDEPLLRAMLDLPATESRVLFRWLGGLTFVERDREGLVPHALVRNALYDELALSNQERHRQLFESASPLLLERIGRLDPLHGPGGLMRALYMRRKASPILDPFRFENLLRCYYRPVTAESLEPLAAIVERWEGADSSDRFRRAFALDPSFAFAVHTVTEPLGVHALVSLARAPRDLIEGDPLLERAHALWKQLEPEGRYDLALARWWMTADGYHAFGPAMAAIITGGPFVTSLYAPSLRYATFAASPSEVWAPLAPAFGMRAAETVEAFGRRYSLAYADVHELVGGALPPRETRAGVTKLHLRNLAALGEQAAPGAPIDHETFVAAVKAALPSLLRPNDLRGNALVDARIARGAGARGAVRAIERACDALANRSGYAESGKILRATYLGDSSKQTATAAELNLAWGTYRHKLRRAIDDLVAELWREEREP